MPNAHDIAAAYDRWASSYDRDDNRTRDLDGEVLRGTFANERFEVVVEAGCGTGKNTVWLATRCARLHALDVSAGMLAVAQGKEDAAHVAFTQCDLLARWPIDDGAADLVTFDLVLEHLPQLPSVFGEAARVLRSGGVLWSCELHPFRQYAGKQAHFVRDGEVVRVPAFVHHTSDYVQAAIDAGFTVAGLREWWHDDDAGRPPRLLSLRCRKV